MWHCGFSLTMTTARETVGWVVERIPKDESGLQFYLSHIRPFRLRMLQLAPEAYSSSFERESAFDDAAWLRRASKPNAWTFAAIQNVANGNRMVISSLILIGPSDKGSEFRDSSIAEKQRRLLMWEVNAVFTEPAFRRRGIGTAVLDAAARYALEEATALDADCVLMLGVMGGNAETGARAMYEKAGFVLVSEDELGLAFEKRLYGRSSVSDAAA
ncbi:hypothetical protein QBC47DRAFT_394757 [Echria macrotheca]|uniref:N-acetyltransferase domain-containing protein n=1 Tax=Echria macrotheca TaxID=438768 RepID=A0AAJ0B203_9PEZI|nr:hypothetical protein QBC47DRAFT_394757 [Echria macrotheca]